MFPQERLSGRLERLSTVCAAERVTLREVFSGLGRADHAFLTLITAVCFMHPFPMPGISHALGLIIIIAGIRLSRGQELWLPARLINAPFKGALLARVFRGAAKVLRRLERVIRPRGRWLTAHRFSTQANGAAMALCGLLILVPLPPPTNFPPASALFLISLGILEADGLLLALGYAAATATTAAFIALCFFGWSNLKLLLT